MILQHSAKHKKTVMIVFSLMILAIIGLAVALPTSEKIIKDKSIIEQPAPKSLVTPLVVVPEATPPPAIIPVKTKEPQLPSRGKNRGEIYIVTAYDLSVESCEKPIGHPDYGKTATGYSLKGHSWNTSRSIAVDPHFIPLGSKVLIKFLDERFQQYNGVYTARDTGGVIKGRKIDLFLGDFENNDASQEAIAFGRRQAEVIML